MFSIARYNDEEEVDERSFDKKQERLNKLKQKVGQKRKNNVDLPDTSKKNKLSKSKEQKVVNVKEAKVEEKVVNVKEAKVEEKVVNVKEAKVEEEEEEEMESAEDEGLKEDVKMIVQSEDEVEVTEEADSPTLEAFPSMLKTKTKHNKDEKELLKNMGIPEWLLEPTVISPKDTCDLDAVGLSDRLIQSCQDAGLNSLFAVQKAVIPVFLRRQALYDTRRVPGDLCISAPTGSGKTLAYVLPIVDILSKRVVTRLRAVVVLPTRDLVTQVTETFREIAQGTSLSIGSASGQHSFEQEQRSLVEPTGHASYEGGKSKVDILITTPGRLLDHLTLTRHFTLQHLRFLVIDEADRLLNQSYQDWLNRILVATQPHAIHPPLDYTFKVDEFNVIEHDAVAPSFVRSTYALPTTDLDIPKISSVQKLLFSATLTKNPAKIAELHLNDPEYIAVQSTEEVGEQKQEYTTPEGLKEFMVVCSTEDKPLTFICLLHQIGLTSGLCFTKSIESTQKLRLLVDAYEALQPEEKRLVVKEYSSDIRPKDRKMLIKQFKAGQINLLICSDLIGRGIDLDAVQFVISYDVPQYMDKYIHRVGRTARAGREGEAYTLVEHHESKHFKEILRHAGHSKQLEPYKIEKDRLKEINADYEKALQTLAE